jgi:RNA polymerase sigma factor (sigma-70 family)
VGDEQFLHAVGDHVNMLYNLARRLTTSRAEAEDLVQETFVRALRGWRRKPPDEVRPWLATICLNLARSAYRHRSAPATRGPLSLSRPNRRLAGGHRGGRRGEPARRDGA